MTSSLDNKTEMSKKIPAVGSQAPNFSLVRRDLSEVTLGDFSDEILVLNIFPSLDTSVCANSIVTFASLLGKKKGVKVLDISMDLPFAMKRFCQERSLDDVEVLSAFRGNFGDTYALTIQQGPLKGLLSRAVFILNRDREIIYSEIVANIGHEPNYKAVVDTLGAEA